MQTEVSALQAVMDRRIAFRLAIIVSGMFLADDRRTDYSAATLRATGAGAVAALVRRLEHDPRFAVHAQAEPAYYAAQAGSAAPMLALSIGVAFLMGVACVFGAINTMQASLAARRREIAVLRALGFSTPAIGLAFMVEALLQTLPGGLAGCVVALAVNGRESHMLNVTSFASVGFQFRVTWEVMAAGMAFATLIGVVAGLWPAWSAARTPVALALKR